MLPWAIRSAIRLPVPCSVVAAFYVMKVEFVGIEYDMLIKETSFGAISWLLGFDKCGVKRLLVGFGNAGNNALCVSINMGEGHGRDAAVATPRISAV